MTRLTSSVVVALAIGVSACSRSSTPPAEPAPAAAPAPPPAPPALGLYVTNEQSGDLSIIDVTAQTVVGTVKLGKRPRGIAASPDGTTLYVALSGSPASPPGVDEKTLPPPDRTADGIGVVYLTEGKLIKVLPSGTDPEQLAVSHDGKQVYVANEDGGLATVL